MSARPLGLGRHDAWLLIRGAGTARGLSRWTTRQSVAAAPPVPCGRGWWLLRAVLDDAHAAHVADCLSMAGGGLVLQSGRGPADGVLLAEPDRPARSLPVGPAHAGADPQAPLRAAAVTVRWLERQAPRRPPADAPVTLGELYARGTGRDLLDPLLRLGGWRAGAARPALPALPRLTAGSAGLLGAALGVARPRTAW